MRRLIIFLFGWLKFNTKTDTEHTNRNHPRNIKPGDYVVIEWDKIKNKIGRVKCLNNDTVTQKLLLEVKWNNHKEVPGTDPTEQLIVDYFGSHLKNFNLLNPLKKQEEVEEETDEFDIAKLQSDLNKALDAQEYEKARELQNKIDKLVNKK